LSAKNASGKEEGEEMREPRVRTGRKGKARRALFEGGREA
jgi:hypothetical protein